MDPVEVEAAVQEGVNDREETQGQLRDAGERPHFLPVNDSSVLPSFIDDRNLLEDGAVDRPDFDGKDGKGEMTDAKLIVDWKNWAEHRGSSRLRTTVTPDDPEEDHDETDRFISGLVANASSNPSVMDSLMFHRQDNIAHRNQDHHDQMNVISSVSATGFNMKQYEEELIKLRNDNFSLKLRIRLLEERQGLEVRPGENNQENVYRVNLDLRVEKETLKQQIDEKDKLLRDAYNALEDMEREKSRFEAEVQNFLVKNQDDGKISDKSQQLLSEAFGSMNLGTRPQKDEASDAGASLLNFEELERLQTELESVKQKVAGLQETNDQKQNEIEKVAEERTKLDTRMRELKITHENETMELNVELESKHMECVKLRQEFDEKDHQINQLREKIEEVERELKEKENKLQVLVPKYKELHERCSYLAEREQQVDPLREYAQKANDERLQQKEMVELLQKENENLQNQISILKSNIENDSNENSDKVTLLERDLEAARQELKNVEENKMKGDLTVSGLTKMNGELKAKIDHLESGIEKRNQALDLIKAEYEKLKATVRRYREEHRQKQGRPSSASSKCNSSNDEVAKIYEELTTARAEVEKLREINERDKIAAISGASGDNVLKEELRLSQKEVELLRGELKLCKSEFIRTGASKAVEKMEEVYKKQMIKIDRHHGKIVDMLKQRLEELSVCIQKLINGRFSSVGIDDESLLDISNVLNESKQFSRSILDCSTRTLDDANETQLPENVFSFPSEEIMQEFVTETEGDSGADLSPATATTMVGKRLKEYESLMEELRDSSKRVVSAEDQVKLLKRELAAEQDKNEEMSLKYCRHQSVVDDLQSKLKSLEGKLAQYEQEITDLKLVLAETRSTVENLRIKNGHMKETLVATQDENRALQENSKRTNCKVNAVTEEFKKKLEIAETRYSKLFQKYQGVKENAGDGDDLKREVEEMKSKLAKYQEEKEKVNGVLKHEWAKIHKVLKMTNDNNKK